MKFARPSLFLPIVVLASAIVATNAAIGEPACIPKLFETSRFTVCAVDTARQDVQLAWTDKDGIPLRGFDRLESALGAKADHVRFAMNAGMFDRRGTPIGLYVENGTTRVPANTKDGAGNFYLKPNGVFWIDASGMPGIDTTERYIQHQRSPRWATQSGPMLAIDGQLNQQIAPDGPSKFIRNGVGIRDAHTAVFVISDDAVSFGRMARLFRDVLACPNALYFDGAVSSLWLPSIDRKGGAHPLGPMVVVTDR
jgi:uncharacterized protein YigE (DUF2233 family)